MRTRSFWILPIVVCLGACLTVQAYRMSPTEPPQDVINLDRRIGMVEQRIYSIESRLSKLEQPVISSLPSAPVQSMRDPDVASLRGEIELLKGRVRELECGVVRLDERTLSVKAKEARPRNGAQPKDTCRQEVDAPVRLSMRPF